MTTADRIRAAALGPTPKPDYIRLDWIEMSDLWTVSDERKLGPGWGVPDFRTASNIERRMFLLFVAEALQSDEQKTSEDQP